MCRVDFDWGAVMDYMKFNCYDLAAQNIELYNVFCRLRPLSEELTDIYSKLDPQIKSYLQLNHDLTAAMLAAADIASRILKVHDALDKIVDVYDAAENRVNESVEALPITTSSGKSNTAPVSSSVLTSSISNGDLILEDWLAELVYNRE